MIRRRRRRRDVEGCADERSILGRPPGWRVQDIRRRSIDAKGGEFVGINWGVVRWVKGIINGRGGGGVKIKVIFSGSMG